jgi:hypothetical protein
MRVTVRRGGFPISQYLVFFLVVFFAGATAGEWVVWSLNEGRLDLTHWQPIVERDRQDRVVSGLNAIERGDFRQGLNSGALKDQVVSVRLAGANLPSQLNRTNLSNSIKLPEFRDDFNAGRLDPERWRIIQEGDVRQSIIDVTAVDPTNPHDYRLRLGMNTLGTHDDTVKFIGVRTTSKFSLHAPTEIFFDLDWNNQSNGSYLTAAIYLCPTATNTNPEREEEWLRFEYIGVPPGQNARAVIAAKDNGSVRHLHTEGWPEQRTGRHIGFQRIRVILDSDGFTILENGTLLYHIDSMNLKSESIYLYLMMSSHSNYPFREIYFDNISVLHKYDIIKGARVLKMYSSLR